MKVEDFKEILYQKEDNGIVTVTLNIPKRKNALSLYTYYEILMILPKNPSAAEVISIPQAWHH
jgi:1,4-dihydroxy-2-naphthoyl-CoA synthase